MSTKTHRSSAERIGRWLGLMWSGYAHREQQACGWLVAQGLPAVLAKALLWIVKLGVLALLFYGAFWLALLLIFAIAAALMASNADVDESNDDDDPQWRNGLDGYGLYRGEIRIDGGSADDD